MIDLPTVIGIIMAFLSIICGLWLTIKSMHRNEDRANAMSDETDVVVSETVAGQSVSLLQLLQFTKRLELTDTTVETDKSIKVSPRKTAKANHERSASDFIPHKCRDEIAA